MKNRYESAGSEAAEKEKLIMRLGRYIKRLMDRYKYNENKKVFAFYMILHAMVVLTGIRCFLTQNYENVLVCILALILFLAPAFIEERMDISIPPLFQIIIFFFIFAAEILGEVNHYYVKIPGWDTMLHTMNGFLCATVGFSLVYLLNRGSKNVNLSPFYLTLVAFCFSMTIGVLWEFFEFAMDQIFYLDIGIIDTMKDLLVNLVGAIVFSFIGYFTLRTSKASKVAESFMIKPNEHDEA